MRFRKRQREAVEQGGGAGVLDWQLLKAAQPAMEHGEPVKASFALINTDRAIGTLLSNEISKKFGKEGLPAGAIHFHIKGSAGQSFDAFAAPGLRMELEGETNDYFGKGLSGAQVVVYLQKATSFAPEENIVIGNVAFYGATSGEAYINGLAGERFCVRNSGVTTVVEGVGDHACEYMTGGTVVILGETGRNFAAGMSGGMAYVFDPESKLSKRCNMEMVDFGPIEFDDQKKLRQLVENHLKFTGSSLASRLLANWEQSLSQFTKVLPGEYKAVLEERKGILKRAV